MPVYTTHEQIEIDRLLALARDLLKGGYVPDHLVPPVVNFLATGDVGYYGDYGQYEPEWAANIKEPAIQFVRALWLLSPFTPEDSIEQVYVYGNAEVVREIRRLMQAHDLNKPNNNADAADETSTPG